MATTLSEFLSHIKKNSIARTNRFRLNFTLPINVVFEQPDVDRVLSLTCLMADVPGRQAQVTSINYGNYDRKVVFGRSTNDFSTTFLLTGKYAEKKAFDAWFDLINDEKTRSVEYYDNYISAISVECLNEADQVVYRFELTEAYPVAVGNLRLDRTAQNAQMVLDITWAYHKMNVSPDPLNQNVVLSNTPVPPGIPVGVPGDNAGKQRLFPVPGIDQLSAAVQSAASVGTEFRGQLQGVLNIAKDVREQVRDLKMSTVDGVKILNGVVKDVKAINGIPTDVKNEVVSVVTDTRNQLGYLKDDIKNISNYPTR